MIDYNKYSSALDDEGNLKGDYATFVFAYVLQGKFTKTEEIINISVSQSEFNNFTKAKQNKLLVEWELKAYKQFIKSLFNNSDVLERTMPTDFVSCEFKGIETDYFYSEEY